MAERSGERHTYTEELMRQSGNRKREKKKGTEGKTGKVKVTEGKRLRCVSRDNERKNESEEERGGGRNRGQK